jgi:hypothetical protein
MMPAPAYLTADWRYAGDDWQGANALEYTVNATDAVYATDGVTVTTPAVPLNLNGFEVKGVIYLRRQASVTYGRYQPSDPGSPIAFTPIGAVVDAINGIITLSLPSAQTLFPRQPLAAFEDPDSSLLLIRPQVVDGSSNVLTVGLQPLFVF